LVQTNNKMNTAALFIFAFLFADLVVCEHIAFVLDFHGSFDDQGETLNVSMRAASQDFRVRITNREGVRMETHNLIGARAGWVSTMIFTDSTTFTDSGILEFGTHMHTTHGLVFASDTQGKIFPAPNNEQELFVGTATYRIEDGLAEWKGAQGTMVVSFVATSEGTRTHARALATANFWV